MLHHLTQSQLAISEGASQGYITSPNVNVSNAGLLVISTGLLTCGLIWANYAWNLQNVAHIRWWLVLHVIELPSLIPCWSILLIPTQNQPAVSGVSLLGLYIEFVRVMCLLWDFCYLNRSLFSHLTGLVFVPFEAPSPIIWWFIVYTSSSYFLPSKIQILNLL